MAYDPRERAGGAPAPKGTKSGMILAFALIILMLMSLMGVIILSSTQTELKISSNSKLGREAFNSADSCARLATLMTIVLLNPKDESVSSMLRSPGTPSPRFPLTIEMQPKFNAADLHAEATNFDYTQRYLDTGLGSATAEPHIIFKMNDRVIATAVVNIDTETPIFDGGSLGTGEPHESGDGPSMQVGIVVSVTGRTTTGINVTGDEPTSVVTIMYRNFI
ncbi:MAG: pilus assembly PilX N-terminal domain-containing protein [Deltaproteobacteria bacterium]|jgi:hypothetical protein|nr:pilus assembly PilX N-terminal domain-containing protein [Deltaproteobacteria bacterium]